MTYPLTGETTLNLNLDPPDECQHRYVMRTTSRDSLIYVYDLCTACGHWRSRMVEHSRVHGSRVPPAKSLAGTPTHDYSPTPDSTKWRRGSRGRYDK